MDHFSIDEVVHFSVDKYNQLLLFDDTQRRIKFEKADHAVEALRERFGKWSVFPASLIGSFRYSEAGHHEVIMPGLMHT